MAQRTTPKQLEALLEALRSAAQKAGIAEAARWQLDTGSKTYGRAYRLWLKHEDYPAYSGHYTPAVTDYLGMTANEAERTMSTLRSAFLAVAWAREGDAR